MLGSAKFWSFNIPDVMDPQSQIRLEVRQGVPTLVNDDRRMLMLKQVA